MNATITALNALYTNVHCSQTLYRGLLCIFLMSQKSEIVSHFFMVPNEKPQS